MGKAMEWQESDFHAHADATLEALFEQMEAQDEAGALDLDLHGGVLSADVGGKTLILSKHAPSRQIWLASPLTGGMHFSAERQEGDWVLTDGRQLSVILAEELRVLTGFPFLLLPRKGEA
jgi:frataxin